MTMSCVADVNATNTANAATRPRFTVGFDPEISHRPKISRPWHTSIHARRCPSMGPSTGTLVRSISGAQRNLSEYERVASAKKPISCSDTPDVRSQAESVSNTKRFGRPAAKPSASITRDWRSKNTARAAQVDRFGAGAA